MTREQKAAEYGRIVTVDVYQPAPKPQPKRPPNGTQGLLTITIPARDLRPGDYVVGNGVVSQVFGRGSVCFRTPQGPRIVGLNERLEIHLEDIGQE